MNKVKLSYIHKCKDVGTGEAGGDAYSTQANEATHIFEYCLVLLQVPKCFVPVQIFWASPKIWLHLVPLQKLLCLHKTQFYWIQIIFLSGTNCWWLPQYVNKFLVWHKKFRPAQNILGPVKGQDISKNNMKSFCGLFYRHESYTQLHPGKIILAPIVSISL